jgi:dipeptidyl aminopeptidase/acylaminoacyl peptidase
MSYRLSRMVLAAAAVAAVTALSSAVSTEHRTGFTLEQVLGSPFPSSLVAAAHVPRVAWIFNARGVRNVWVADAPSFKARQVTRYTVDDGLPMVALVMTPDGATVVYVRGTETNGAGQVANPLHRVVEPKQQVYAVDVDKGEPRLLGDMNCGGEGCEDVEISPDGTQAAWAGKGKLWIAPLSGAEPARTIFVRGNASQPRWSPDSKRVAFVSGRGDHSLIAVYEIGRDTISYLAPGVDRDLFPRWSPDGRRVAFVRLPGRAERQPLIPQIPVPWSIFVVDSATGQASVAWRSGPALADSFPGLTEGASFHFAASDRIVFSSEQDGWNHLYAVSVNGGPATLLTPGAFETEDVSLSVDRAAVLYSSNQGDIERRHLWRVPVTGGTPQALTRGDTIEWSPVEAADGSVVCLGSTATSPAMPYRVRASAREMIAADALPADFPSAELVVPKTVTFKAEGGWTIHAQLFEPRARSGPAPATLFIHGGSMRQMLPGFHYMDYYHNAYAMNQYLANLGYVVLSVNYRTGIMYGRDFREPSDGGPRGVSEYKDIVAAGRYLQELSGVDRTKIGSWGGSYGGYLTAMALARNSDIFKAGVDLHGVHDWNLQFVDSEELPKDAPDLETYRALAFRSSPDSWVATWKSPVLLIQGDDDRNVPFFQTVDLVQRLRAQKVPFELLVLPDEIHGFVLWRSWVQSYAASADFLERVLRRGERVRGNQ